VKIEKFFAVLISALIIFAPIQVTASALWINDAGVEKATRTFRIREGGELEVRFINTNGERMNLYKNGEKYLVDRPAPAINYQKEGMTNVGDSLVISDFANIIYPLHTFGYLEIVPKHSPGYILDRFIDESCGCYAELENRDGVYTIYENTVPNIEVIFNIVDFAEVKTGGLASGNVNMNINGKPIAADPPAYIKDGRTMHLTWTLLREMIQPPINGPTRTASTSPASTP
jgi:hypothetical protein